MSAVNLSFRKIDFQNGKFFSPVCEPIIVLHGLFGSSKNWLSVGDFLSQYADVYLLDLRNHGDSPHSSEHSIASMVEDIEVWVTKQKLEKPVILGHSMGGLVSMGFALKNPNILSLLFIEDIAPRNYPFHYESELLCLRTDVSSFKSRQEIDSALTKILPNAFIRNFLEMNLERLENNGGYRWKLNVEGVANSPRLFQDFFDKYTNYPYTGRTYFITGEVSEYFHKEDIEIARNFFPNSKFYLIPGGDHYIHFTKSFEFKKILESIFEKLDDSEFVVN
ncbi:alpha/beta hydrolase family protein [Leptospira interrogans str. 2003000735]|uniref:Alpha/beta hydrolase family protein n=1 Tax=Leptospira interrogans str. 2002000626 TaxID=996803 RepID=A0A829D1K6_LEPIR|nr:alpha/beta fold hydrolase [Leptospira interrogans]EMY02618.1 alpha/beta hydrolase family protein [Leptospira interrogans str. 2002000626]EKN88837.1 alpha/beta hydrolase family protein [Leptospira interrogans str. 2002000624]EKQ37781.1 alpha/beta hydrolase family protein [Leptospira interrogans str. 2002000621]EKQ48125.1 alpha/beta hydrolase family protein [Leptospira interrogans str. 2002000623]EMJ73295.1 alpha/beta hydrolase family protein [Leptospira interrogans str. 2003000735]